MMRSNDRRSLKALIICALLIANLALAYFSHRPEHRAATTTRSADSAEAKQPSSQPAP
jgi:hypothetical protein